MWQAHQVRDGVLTLNDFLFQGDLTGRPYRSILYKLQCGHCCRL